MAESTPPSRPHKHGARGNAPRPAPRRHERTSTATSARAPPPRGAGRRSTGRGEGARGGGKGGGAGGISVAARGMWAGWRGVRSLRLPPVAEWGAGGLFLSPSPPSNSLWLVAFRPSDSERCPPPRPRSAAAPRQKRKREPLRKREYPQIGDTPFRCGHDSFRGDL